MKKSSVISYYGDMKSISEVLGVDYSAVRQWDDEIPVNRAYELHDLTDGELETPISIDENGTSRSSIVWTNVAIDEI